VLDDVIARLVCPSCGESLVIEAGAVCCSTGHSFDIARQGYVNLLPGGASASTADTADMVRARAAFLATDAFAPLADGIVRAVTTAAPKDAGCIVDVGAGTGHYLARLLEALPSACGLALDLSKHAAALAARAHPRIGAAVCDTWDALPVASGAAAVVLDVFAPRNVPEFRRILAMDGALVVVTPTGRHLRELVGPLGLLTVDPAKEERLETAMEGLFEHDDTALVESVMHLSRDQVSDLVAMGPSARHAGDETATRLAALPETTEVALSVRVATYRTIPR
jgi:23S rRNA (guanine745-N1)-methyltransferase